MFYVIQNTVIYLVDLNVRIMYCLSTGVAFTLERRPLQQLTMSSNGIEIVEQGADVELLVV